MNSQASLRIGNLKDDLPYQASKWLQSQALLDISEMESLLQAIGDFHIFMTGSVLKRGEGEIAKIEFLEHYKAYIEPLKKGFLPSEEGYRSYFSSVFTTDLAALYAILVDPEQQLVRVSKPVIQLQPHCMDYSVADGKFRSMALGTNSISWGIQFSYPQLFQEGKTKEVMQVDESFSNTKLFRNLQRWIRHNTIPTPFIVEGKLINVPMRLGKQCLSWINQHPQLIKKQLQVKVNDAC